MSPILTSIRSLLPDDDLRSQMAARTAYRVPADGTIDPAAIVTLETIEQGLARGVIPVDELRVFGAYSQLDLERVGVVKGKALRPLALRGLARQGGTVVVNNAQRLTPELWDLACAAERWLGTGVTLAAVISFGQSGIELHYDSADLIIVHLNGSKTWSFFGPAIADSAKRFTNHHRDPPTEITGEVTMRPGDLLYVPSGLFHRCTPGDWSLHLGIIVSYPSAAGFANYAAELVNDEARAGAPLPGFLGEEAVAAELEAVKARMIAQIAAIDPMAWYAEHQARRARIQSLDLSPGAPTAEGMATLNVTIGPASNGDMLSAAHAALVATPAVQAVVAALREKPLAVAALPGLLGSDYSVEAVAAALAKLADAGLVRIDTV
ncbi:cupin domain-containing protein [Sphingomonas sp. LB-2]|uniref:cupin domain-containing protein n=1 Tax=Sphingomonas caeni TaxID=2984949 RepID=UPI002231CCFD|nr:cupin domain-containing protein [Sphingomonas caeni]MCW3847392.1 cupin domain-containing protein [Sphingomonas caeni]